MKKISKNSKILESNLEILLQKFIDHLSVKNKSNKTSISYYHDVLNFLVWYQIQHGKRIDRIDKRKISEYLNYLSTNLCNENNQVLSRRLRPTFLGKFFKTKAILKPSSKLSANSRKRKLSSISQFFNFLIADETLGKKFSNNPVNKTLHSIQLKDVDIAHTRRLSLHDFELLIEKNYRIRDQLILHLLFHGGLRLAEITGLKSDDLDRETKVLNLRRKGGLKHRLKIQNFSKIEFLWDRYMNSIPQDSIYLFSTKKLNFEKAISERAMAQNIMRCFTKADLTYKKLTPHSFRKGCASEMYHKTKDLLLVRDYLNHQDAKVTQTYVELFD